MTLAEARASSNDDRQLQPQIDLFPCRELLSGLVICESIEKDERDRFIDIHRWGNATTKQPPFILYLGHNSPQERDDYIAQLRHIWKIDTEITCRPAKRVTGYWHEIKVRGMQRHSDPDVFDLEYLSESKQYGLDFLVHFWQMQLEAAAYEEMTISRSLTSV
jgi:hypothetical protein